MTRFGRKEGKRRKRRGISRDVPFLERIKKGSALFGNVLFEVEGRRIRFHVSPLDSYGDHVLPFTNTIHRNDELTLKMCLFTRENNRENDNGLENPEKNARGDGGCITSSRTTINDIWQTFREREREREKI